MKSSGTEIVDNPILLNLYITNVRIKLIVRSFFDFRLSSFSLSILTGLIFSLFFYDRNTDSVAYDFNTAMSSKSFEIRSHCICRLSYLQFIL